MIISKKRKFQGNTPIREPGRCQPVFCDAVSAYGPKLQLPNDLIGATQRLVAGVKQRGARRLLAVGGAGTLEVAPGVRLVGLPMLPPEWKPVEPF